MRKLIYLASLAGMLLIMNSCTTTGYVSSEPTYQEYARPDAPSALHVWVNGDWVYNRQTHLYVQNNGYWHRPNRGRVYIQGSWETTPQGHRWQSGHWERQD